MADYTESSNGNLIFRIAAAGGTGHIFDVRSRGSGAAQFTVQQDKTIVLHGDFLRDAVQIVNNSDSSTDIAKFQSGGTTVASITKEGIGVFSGGGAQLPVYDSMSRPASGASGDIILYDEGAGDLFLYMWDAGTAAWVPLQYL